MSIGDVSGSVERELRVEIGLEEAEAVHRCLLAQVGTSKTPDLQVTSLYFEDASASAGSGIELLVQWADGPKELDHAPAVAERRTRQGAWVALQRMHLPRQYLKAVLRPSTRTELVPFLPSSAKPLAIVDARRVLFRDPEGGFIATLTRDNRFFSLSDTLEIGGLLRRSSSCVLSVRPLQGELPAWLEGLVKMGVPYDELTEVRRAAGVEEEELPSVDISLEDDEAVPPAQQSTVITHALRVEGEGLDEEGELVPFDLREADPNDLQDDIRLNFSARDYNDALAEDWFEDAERRPS